MALGPSIIHLHLLPLLPAHSLNALAATDTALYGQLSHLRFAHAQVRRSRRPGCIIKCLSPDTLRTITHLSMNGNGRYYIQILMSEFLTGVRSMTITKRIKREQQHLFTDIASRLTELVEIGDGGAADGNCSVSNLPKGTLRRLEILYLQDVKMPPIMNLLCGSTRVACCLTTLSWMPSLTEEIFAALPLTPDYIDSTIDLLRILRNRHCFQALRTVAIALGRSFPDGRMNKARTLVLDAVWGAAAAHRGWKLLAQKPKRHDAVHVTNSIDAWECWCSAKTGDLFLTVLEVTSFGLWCEQNNRYPRWDDIVTGNIHIDIPSSGTGARELQTNSTTANLANVHGVSVLPGKSLDLPAALSLVSHRTRCVLIQLQSRWPTASSLFVDSGSGRFNSIEVFRLEVIPADMDSSFFSSDSNNSSFDGPPEFNGNISAAIISGLELPLWAHLRALSVPAIALERFLTDTELASAVSCGRHIPAYAFDWLARCDALQKLQITNWEICLQCYERFADAVAEQGDGGGSSGWNRIETGGQSLVAGLAKSVPVGVKAVSITVLLSPATPPAWRKMVQEDVGNVLGVGVELDFSAFAVEVYFNP